MYILLPHPTLLTVDDMVCDWAVARTLDVEKEECRVEEVVRRN